MEAATHERIVAQLRAMPWLQGVASKLPALVTDESVLSFGPEDTVYSQGQRTSTSYVIVSGTTELGVRTPETEHLAVTTLGPGQLFGHLSALTGRPRVASAVVRESSLMLTIEPERLNSLANQSRRFRAMVLTSYVELSLRLHLRKIDIFTGLDSKTLKVLTAMAEVASYEQGATILEEGKRGDYFQTVHWGAVAAEREVDGRKVVTEYLTSGRCFGRAAALKDTATAPAYVAATDVEVVRFPIADFGAFLKRFPEAARELAEWAQRIELQYEAAQFTFQLAKKIEFLAERGLTDLADVLAIDLARCTRCNACVEACEAVRAYPLLVHRGLRTGRLLLPSVCRQCEDPRCLQCEQKALGRDVSGEITVTADLCIGCGACTRRCPYGSLTVALIKERTAQTGIAARLMSSSKRIAVKCDMCRGRGRKLPCVQNCPTGAIRLVAPRDLESW